MAFGFGNLPSLQQRFASGGGMDGMGLAQQAQQQAAANAQHPQMPGAPQGGQGGGQAPPSDLGQMGAGSMPSAMPQAQAYDPASMGSFDLQKLLSSPEFLAMFGG